MNQSLCQALERAPLFSNGVQKVRYGTDQFDFVSVAAEHVRSRGFASTPLPLDSLHHRVRRDDQLPVEGPLSKVSSPMYETLPALRETYHRFVGYIAREILGFDVVFEKNPFLRFHFPVPLPDRYRAPDGALLTHHSDTLLGDYFEQINCWLPLSTCYGTNALQCARLDASIVALRALAEEVAFDEAKYSTSRRRFFDKLLEDRAYRDAILETCAPLETRFGELVMFDPRMIHGTAENVEDGTRVSIDFRLVPVTAYEEHARSFRELGRAPPEFDGKKMVKGGYYDERTAFEL